MTCIHQRFVQGLGAYFRRWVRSLLVYINRKAKPLLHEEIEGLIKSLDNNACGLC